MTFDEREAAAAAKLCDACEHEANEQGRLFPKNKGQAVTTRIWEFRKPNKHGRPTVEITMELRSDQDHLGASAEDSYYYGDLTKEESLDLARAVLDKLDPVAFSIGDHVRVVDGAMCGYDAVVLGTVRETGCVVLRCGHGLLLQPAKFLKGTL